MVNPEVKRNFVIRSKFIKHLRNYLDSMGYIEVETPVLNTIAGVLPPVPSSLTTTRWISICTCASPRSCP